MVAGGSGNLNLAFPTSGSTDIATATTAGTATVKYTFTATGCSTTDVITISAFPTNITGTMAVCEGSTTTLSEVDGTWTTSNGNATMTVTVGGGGATSSAHLTGITPGRDTITFTSGSGCSIDTSIAINDTPSAIITPLGATTICPGGFVELTAGTGTGYTYEWYKGATAEGTGATYLAAPTTTSNYSVNVSNGPCSVSSNPITVAVSPVSVTITSSGPLSACASSPPLLTAMPGFGSGAVTYQWEDGGVALAGAVAATYTPSVSGTYDIVVTNTTGCSAAASASVTLNASPAGLVTAGGATSFCAGDSVILTADAGTGYSYQWYSPLTTAIPGATNMSYTALTSGTYYVIDGNGSCTTTSAGNTVVVNPLPASTITETGDTIICYGSTLPLTANPGPPGNTYQWYDNGSVMTGVTSQIFTADTTGAYSVLVTTGALCSQISEVQHVMTVTQPVFNPLSATSFCWGGSVLLSTVVVGGIGPVTYAWSRDGVIIAGAVSSSYVANVPGVYSFSVTAGGCIGLNSSSTATVTEYDLPDPIIHMAGSTLYTQDSFVSYTWYNGGPTAISSGPKDTAIASIGPGTYTVRVVDSQGCQSVSEGFIVAGSGPSNVGAVTVTGADIKIYPNPAQTMVHIQSPVTVRAIISSVDGRELINQPAAKDVDISALPDGIYMIMLYDDSNTLMKTAKVIKAAN